MSDRWARADPGSGWYRSEFRVDCPYCRQSRRLLWNAVSGRISCEDCDARAMLIFSGWTILKRRARKGGEK